jgi:hypothetical protein
MATTNPATLKLSEADDAPIQVYGGRRKAKPAAWAADAMPYYGFGVPQPDLEEDYYTDVTGKEIEGPFDPKRHKKIGEIKDGIRVPFSENSPLPSWMPKFGPAYSGPMARQQPYSGPMARPTGNQAAPFKIPSIKPQSTPDAVRASAQTSPAQEARQKSIAEEQADYIRKRGGRTAEDVSAQDAYNKQMNYKEMTGFDISTAEGRRQSENAALLRGGHADAMARNLRAGKYAYLDPNSDAGMRASDAAFKKHFEGKDWVGDNPLTGQYKDVERLGFHGRLQPERHEPKRTKR